MKKIIIFDTTLRDGEQSPGASLTMQEKIIVAKQLAKLGVDVIEAGFPISSEGDFESVKLIAKEIKGPIICGLARTRKEDIDRAWEAVKYSKKPRIHTFIATSQVHMDNKLRKSKEEVMQMAVDAVKHARSLCKDIEFSPEDSARTDLDYMCDIIKAVIEAGATTINIPDTVGYAEPEEFGKRIKYVFEKLNNIIKSNKVVISIHCHNDLGLAVANSLEAVNNGATQVECTINGIGERAGNCSLEEVVMNLKTRKDFFKDITTGINTKEIFKTSQLVSSLTGIAVQRNKAIVGSNAFAHEAGIHQHGMLMNKLTYEIMKPEEIGWIGTTFVIGKHSGKHAVENALKEMGYDLTKEQVEKVIIKVKELADKQKVVMREDIIAIATDIAGELSKDEEIIKLDEIKVSTGNKMQPEAAVTLIIDGKKKTGTGKGVGPVDAVSHAIRTMIDPSITLKEYGLKAITGGTDALADVSIKIQDKKGNIFKAEAVNEDIMMASAIALIKGMNKALNFQRNKKGNRIHAQY
ncbi:MAG: 2-isopropylmalate synthase [Nanoarchaeota archaeon]|nr:2-isopropylmalate synthase [Nanoarchaeota archaeon]MBU1004420.1 2-isopropylmalate synthase [Nanoarchaeota archaeon]MBU1946693.1 2-isopropylmalate synthase [Nanoarchaeota archaeon]